MQIEIDAPAVARSLSQVATASGAAEVFLEALEVARKGPSDEPQIRRECGLAVRVRDGHRLRMASDDGLDAEAFETALKSVASVLPQAPYRPPDGECHWQDEPSPTELVAFDRDLKAGLKRRQVAVDYRLDLERIRRQVVIVGTRLTHLPQSEAFYSLRVDLPWASLGRLSVGLDDSVRQQMEKLISAAVRASTAEPMTAGRTDLLLSPQVAGVVFHEAVGHALEADVLDRTGAVEGAHGVRLTTSDLNVLDDPAAALDGVNRVSDDEGSPVSTRWLLRQGVVEEPVADNRWASRLEVLTAGCGRVSDRHQAPAPRVHHLSVLPGSTPWEAMLAAADGGWFVPEVTSGRLDPHSGVVEIVFGWGRRIEDGKVGATAGRFRLRMHLGELLARLALLGDTASFSGAGWCAKDGHRLPVWATTPPVLIKDVEVEPWPT